MADPTTPTTPNATNFPWATFSYNLERLVDWAGSPEHFTVLTGISFYALREWRAGSSIPRTLSLLAVSEVFEVSLDDLLHGVIPREAPQKANET